MGLDTGASAAQVKQRYRQWMRMLHPDSQQAKRAGEEYAAAVVEMEAALGRWGGKYLEAVQTAQEVLGQTEWTEKYHRFGDFMGRFVEVESHQFMHARKSAHHNKKAGASGNAAEKYHFVIDNKFHPDSAETLVLVVSHAL